MEGESVYYIVLGMVIGALLGLLLGGANDNTPLGFGLGALGGVFLGWFVAAAAIEIKNQKKKDE